MRAKLGAFEGMVTTTRLTTKLFAPIKTMMVQWFAAQGFVARPIFRNDPRRFGSSFGGDCPHNLLPKSPEANHVTIYVEFNNADIHLGNIQRIIAFHDLVAPHLPRFPRVSAEYEKVNLAILSDQYIFRDWEDLKANYRRILVH